MYEFSTKLTLNRDTILSPNLAGKFGEEDLHYLGNMVWDGYMADLQSRAKWEKRTQAGMDLALQMSNDKNFPWPGCSNVAFPLVTIAALQFHSRAYPTVVQTPNIVKCRVVGEDPDGERYKQAHRISRHMSWQILEDDRSWEEQHDRLLINVPIVGCAFKKTYHNGSNRSELVLAQDLVLNYYAKSVEECTRKTHRILLSRNQIYEGVKRGIYTNVLDESWFTSPAVPTETKNQSSENRRDGMTVPPPDWDTPIMALEQHRNIDLDGDGYAEPYIVTIEEKSRCVLRIVTRFDREDAIERNSRNEIVKVTPVEYFTKYSFIPSPDGGIYDLGFGVLLGPLNESVNSILNQLVDAGTMANTAGGFLGRGAKIRGGQYTFAPLEWKRVDSTADDLQKSIYPLPVREPSAVLFQLLSLLINYTGRISGTTDTMVGENPGQNTPAQTTQTMVEQGMKIYSAIFKRVWRSMKEEFKKLYILNSIYLPNTQAFGEAGEKALREDYLGNPDMIVPAADPNSSSEQEVMKKAMALKDLASRTPGYNIPEVEKRVLTAMHIEGIEQIYPGPDKIPPPTNPKVMVEQLRLQAKQMQLEAEQQQFAAELMETHQLNQAKIQQMEAMATKLLSEAQGVETGHQLAAIDAIIGGMKAYDEQLMARAKLAVDTVEKIANGRRADIQTMARASRDASLAQAPAQPSGSPQG